MDLHTTNARLSTVLKGNQVIRSGWMHMLSGRGLRRAWKRRFFVLKGNALMYFKSEKSDEPIAGTISLNDYQSIQRDYSHKKVEFCFRLEPSTADPLLVSEIYRTGPLSTSPQGNQGLSSKMGFFRGHSNSDAPLPATVARPIVKPLLAYCEDEDQLEWWIKSIDQKLVKFASNVLESALARLDYSAYQRPHTHNPAAEGKLKSRASADTFDASSECRSVASSHQSSDEISRLFSGFSMNEPRHRSSTTGNYEFPRANSPDNGSFDKGHYRSIGAEIVAKTPYFSNKPDSVRLKYNPIRLSEVHRRRSSPYLQQKQLTPTDKRSMPNVPGRQLLTSGATRMPRLSGTFGEDLDETDDAPAEELGSDTEIHSSGMTTPTVMGLTEFGVSPRVISADDLKRLNRLEGNLRTSSSHDRPLQEVKNVSSKT